MNIDLNYLLEVMAYKSSKAFFTDKNGNVHPVTNEPMPTEVKKELGIPTAAKGVGAAGIVGLGIHAEKARIAKEAAKKVVKQAAKVPYGTITQSGGVIGKIKQGGVTYYQHTMPKLSQAPIALPGAAASRGQLAINTLKSSGRSFAKFAGQHKAGLAIAGAGLLAAGGYGLYRKFSPNINKRPKGIPK